MALTCEHATETLPPGWSWPLEDARLRGTHWSHDLGAAALTRELAQRLASPAVLAGFSRLLVDPNRGRDADTLFRREADGTPIALNATITPDEAARRVDACWRPYHDAVDAMLQEASAPVVLSIHTFTDEYEGERRALEVGILYDAQDALAERAEAAFSRAGFRSALNAPWSGKEGLAYSVERHAAAHGRYALELELRQDLAIRADARARVVEVFAGFFDEVFRQGLPLR